jgi:hypothetical protein
VPQQPARPRRSRRLFRSFTTASPSLFQPTSSLLCACAHTKDFFFARPIFCNGPSRFKVPPGPVAIARSTSRRSIATRPGPLNTDCVVKYGTLLHVPLLIHGYAWPRTARTTKRSRRLMREFECSSCPCPGLVYLRLGDDTMVVAKEELANSLITLTDRGDTNLFTMAHAAPMPRPNG